jgi:hypothetical protein
MSVEECFVVLPFIRYDGTNEAEILQEATDPESGEWSYTEENGVLTITVLYISEDPEIPNASESWSTPVGGVFVLRPRGGIASSYTEEEFQQEYTEVKVVVNSEPHNAMGFGQIGTLGAGGTATVSVTLIPAFNDVNYQAVASIAGDMSILGSIEVQSCSIVDPSHVDVVVKNKSLLSLSNGMVVVQAIK